MKWLKNIILLYLQKEDPKGLEESTEKMHRDIERVMRRSRKLNKNRNERYWEL